MRRSYRPPPSPLPYNLTSVMPLILCTFPCNKINPLFLLAGRMHKVFSETCGQRKIRFFQQPPDRLCFIALLKMCFLIFLISAVLFSDKQRQIICVDPRCFVIVIVPDKLASSLFSQIVVSPKISLYLYRVFRSNIKIPPGSK